jgi:hypothetical protein
MKKNYPAIIIVLVLLFGIRRESNAQGLAPKSPLKILFVGYDPARTPQEFRKGLDEFTVKDSIRMPAFKELLSSYFTEVSTMDCRDWKVEDASPFDVIIFDYRTSALEPSRKEKGDNGETTYVSARYLPDNFSKPVVFIGSTASQMGARIGLKLDWLCLCLDADAHHINTGHAIFKGPLENVVPTLEMEKTPDNIYEYPSGDTVPRKIPMWKVQTLSYSKDDHARIGLVSRGHRFKDSPDAEVISSGVCQKDVTAVALGRHGNFFLWGFSASPADMTAEAKKVFVNTVAYMKQFDGQTPIAREYNERMATTDDVRNIIEWATKKYWQRSIEETNKFNVYTKVQLKKLKEKKAAGTTLTDNEAQLLTIFSTAPPSPVKTWEAYLKDLMGPLAKRFGTDAPAFQKYLKDNMDFMYCDPKGFFSYYVDEDVKKLKVSNHNTKLIETCIKMLKDNKDQDLALRVLKRYTPENFETAAEWDSWYGQNKTRLFFTETGGYKFLVNTLNS